MLRLILRIFVGLVFIVSAVLKLISIDSFEIYIYSFGYLSLNTTFLVARFVISFEILLGVLLLFGFYFKKVVCISMLMLLVFSIFIIILLINNNPEDCHCFGNFVKMSHFTSLSKNLILLFILGYIFKSPERKIKYSFYLSFFLIGVSFSLPFVLFPPDSFMIELYSKKTKYNSEKLNEYLIEKQFTKGRIVLCFFGTGCKFCKLAVKKIAVISKMAGNAELIHYIFLGNPDQINNFFKETNTPVFSNFPLPAKKFLSITDGQMPLILLIEDGQVKKKYGYRDIVEKEILDFLKNSD